MKFGVGVIGATGFIGTPYRSEIRQSPDDAWIVALCARRRDLLEAAGKDVVMTDPIFTVTSRGPTFLSVCQGLIQNLHNMSSTVNMGSVITHTLVSYGGDRRERKIYYRRRN